MKNQINNDSLKWRFDVNTFRLLGRELITDRITAVFELVKNCYDANSTKVTVDLQNVSTKNPNSRIVISDNGTGMSFDDIKNKWMVVGTNSKRASIYSPEPFGRRYVGAKGIGRFAVDKLGSKLLIRTKEIGSSEALVVKVDWDEYETKALKSTASQLSLFTEVENSYYFEPAEVKEHGTTLEISHISETWISSDLERLYKELSKLISPFYPITPPFEIYLNNNESKDYFNKNVKSDPVKYYSHHIELDYNLEEGTQQTLRFDSASGRIAKDEIEIKSFGPVKLKIFYFDEKAKKRYNTAYKNDDTRIDGIKIYRDGVITTPFAEYHSSPDHKRDILGIDKRRWGGAFDKASTREIIGILDIQQEQNSKIIDSTNRQDFIDNLEYRQLKEFILDQIDIFGKLKVFERDSKRTDAERELQKAGQEIKSFSVAIDKIEKELIKEKPYLKDQLEPLKKQVLELSSTINHSINEQKNIKRM